MIITIPRCDRKCPWGRTSGRICSSVRGRWRWGQCADRGERSTGWTPSTGWRNPPYEPPWLTRPEIWEQSRCLTGVAPEISNLSGQPCTLKVPCSCVGVAPVRSCTLKESSSRAGVAPEMINSPRRPYTRASRLCSACSVSGSSRCRPASRRRSWRALRSYWRRSDRISRPGCNLKHETSVTLATIVSDAGCTFLTIWLLAKLLVLDHTQGLVYTYRFHTVFVSGIFHLFVWTAPFNHFKMERKQC